MRQKSNGLKDGAEATVRDIRCRTRKQYSAEEKIRIVLAGLPGEDSIAELCRREGIAESLYYSWSKEFLEATVLGGLKRQLVQPESFAAFCKAFTEEVNRCRLELSAAQAAQKAELERIGRGIAKLVEVLKNAGPAQAIVGEIQKLEARQAELESTLADAKRPAQLLHPNMERIYQQELERLYETLEDKEARQEGVTILRSLIDRLVLMPVKGRLMAQIEGDLAASSASCHWNDKAPSRKGTGLCNLRWLRGPATTEPTHRDSCSVLPGAVRPFDAAA